MENMDPLVRKRVHAWVLVRAGRRDVQVGRRRRRKRKEEEEEEEEEKEEEGGGGGGRRKEEGP